MDPVFTSETSPFGLRITDPILQREYTLQTNEEVSPTTCKTDNFYYPVDSATSILTNELILPGTVSTFVRSSEGDMLAEISHNDLQQFSRGTYLVELSTPIKLILRFTSDFEVATADDRMAFTFPETTEIRVGARSYHDQPAGTITTTSAPADLREAISALSSSLKTTSCERSWPTLRGHPPRIRLGDSLDIPDAFEPLESGVTIEVPGGRGQLYAVAPLAFYLGATLQRGKSLQLRTTDGLTHDLSYQKTFDSDPDPPADGPPHDVGRLLKHVVTLDCLTRTEGYYQVDLHERVQFDDGYASLDFEALYSKSLSEQLEAYLSVPYHVVEQVMPTWRLVADLTPDPETVELLPYLLNDLAVVRVATPESSEHSADPPPEPDIMDFARGATDTPATTGEFARGGTNAGSPEYVTPPDADALEQAWGGPGRPFGAGKLLREGFEHKSEQIESRSADESSIKIAVVCNDATMDAEYSDRGLYGDREEVRYDVREHRNLSVSELRAVFEGNLDFVHYIGHVEDGAFVCHDGCLDPHALDDVGVSAFLLNGCRSYEPGVELVREGAVGGIVTHSDVGNNAAVEIGRVTARLLNQGYSLVSALEISREQRLTGNQYLVVGDGGTAIIQNKSVTPHLCHVERQSDGGWKVVIDTHPVTEHGIGSTFKPYVSGVKHRFLSGGVLTSFELSPIEFVKFLRLEEVPIRYRGELYWSSEFDPFRF